MNAAQVIASRFPNASGECRKLNSTNLVDIYKSVEINQVELSDEAKRKAHQPNRTEQRFLDILDAKKRRGELVNYTYECISIKWGENMWYTPDVMVEPIEGKLLMIELKGAHIRSRDMVRFKGASAEWKHLFDFQMWQWKERQWTRLL